MATDFAAVVMAAGLGTRMKSATPKHLHPLLGRRLVDWVVAAVRPLGPDPLVVVLSPEAAGALDGVEVAVQERPLGTGDSLRARARASATRARCSSSPVIIRASAPGSCSNSSKSTARPARRPRVLSFEPPDPRAYGRIVRDADGHLQAIVEDADADDDAARDSRGQLLHLRLRDCEAMACSRTDRAGERAGRAVPDGRRPLARRRRGGGRRVQGSGCR